MAFESEKIPPAKSLIYGLRCIGYNFSSALADIIDNSISAFAKNIKIISNPDVDPYLVIFDDGIGMNENELDNAMTLGSNRDYRPDSNIELGRFGLGLKSASFSQCLRVTVASKKNNKINAMRYDLEKIQIKNKWILDVLNTDEINNIPEIDLLSNVNSGTIVLWQNFDKINEEAKSFTESFINVIGNAKKHIELIFHRFYDEINFEFNGHKIEKRDPFLSNYSSTQIGRKQKIFIDNKKILVVPFVLPYANSLTMEQKNLLGNPKSIYDEQGFYIYRNKRLIIWGSWLHMNVRSEFNKLARVRVDIPSSLDSIWMLDVKKSSAKIPDKIKEQLRISLNDSISRSKREVRYPGKKESEAVYPLWHRIDLHSGNVRYEINRQDNPLYLKLLEILNVEQAKIMNAYLDKLEEYIPKGMIASDNADSLNIINSADQLEEKKLIEEVVMLARKSVNSDVCVEMLLNGQTYSKIADRKKEIMEMMKNG